MSETVRIALVNESDPQLKLLLPRNPTGFKDSQSPQYSTDHTPTAAVYQALTYNNSGARDFDFRITLLPEIDGAEWVANAMRFLFALVLPVRFMDPRDGIYRLEPPDVTFMYGGMIRRGKVTKRAVTYNHLNQWGVAREIVVDIQLRSYVRPGEAASDADRFPGKAPVPRAG